MLDSAKKDKNSTKNISSQEDGLRTIRKHWRVFKLYFEFLSFLGLSNAMFNKKSLISEPKKVICFSCNEDKCLFVSKRETEMVTILWLYLTTPSH